jgi:hypothetical protein
MAIAFDGIDFPLVETVLNENENEDDDDIREDEASDAGSEMSMSDYGGSVTGLPPWCLFAMKECRCIFELGSDNKSSFYRVCGNVQGVCKHPGHATRNTAVVGYYEPVKARKFIDRRLNTFLLMEEFPRKEQERMEAKRKEMVMASSSFSLLKDSPTGSEEELYF